MPQRNSDIDEEFNDGWEDDVLPSGEYFEKVVDAVAGHNRLLTALYSVLVVGIVFLVLHEEMSVWAGAALLTALVLFLAGIAHTLLHIVAYKEMLLLAEALESGEEPVDGEVGPEEAVVDAFVRSFSHARRLFSSETHYLFLGLNCGAIAVAIEHWEYAWRALVIVAAVIAVILVSEIISRFVGSRSRDSTTETK